MKLYRLVVEHHTGSGWRIPALDGLRGIAATMVLVAHVRGVVPGDGHALLWAPIHRGGLGGVVLFFALSGFLLYLPWLRAELEHRPPPRLATYALRRCLRIMPAYYASVIVLAILRVMVGGREPISAQAIALHFLFLPTLGAPLQTVYWTLQVEEFFYWMLPALHRLVRSIGAGGVFSLTCLSAGVWFTIGIALFGHGSHDLQLWLEQTPFLLPCFGLGIVTAVAWRRPDGFSGRALALAGAIGYVVVSPLAHVMTSDSPAMTPVTALLMAPAASAVVLGVARGGAPWLAHPVLRFLGGISFSLYLWHMVVIKAVPCPPTIAGSFGLRLGFTLAIAVPLALASYLFIERPFLRMRPRGPATSETTAA